MKITAFLCNWCSYEASMKAAGRRLSLPPEITFIRVMCSGMVDPQSVLEAFSHGANGVMILGCHPGDCHYKEGNYHALRRKTLLSDLLEAAGIGAERLVIDWASASEGERFAELVNGFAEKIRALEGSAHHA